MDGCVAITNSNWMQLKEMAVCQASDKTGAVAALILVVANWTNLSKVFFGTDSSLQGDIENTLRFRFS